MVRRFAGPPPPPVNQPPIASFDFLTTGLSVALTDTSVDNDGTVVAWAWDFGDGATSEEQNPTHVFATAGSYIIVLTVTDDDGDTDSHGRLVVVQPGPGGTFGDFTEVTPLDPLWVTPQDEDFWVAATASADYDADGDLDIVVFGYYVVYNESVEDRLVLMRNDGPESDTAWDFGYVELPVGTLTAGASDLAWGDYDGDGDQDLVVGSDGQTVLYRNQAGDLGPTTVVLPGYWEDNGQADFDLRSISWADYDNDGDLDLLLPSIWDEDTFTSRTALMRNDGSDGAGGWVFTEIDTDFGPSDHVQSAWADYDGDLDLDLLLVHLSPLTEEGFIRRFRNDGDGVFFGEEILGTLSVEHGEAQWGDADDDGDLDILVAGNIRETDGTYDTVLRLYRNDAETFVPVELGGGPGTANGHWDERDGGACCTGFTNSAGQDATFELMTGWLNAPVFLSQTTIQSFVDIGYVAAAGSAPLGITSGDWEVPVTTLPVGLVPEPESWVLLVAGLALLVFMARRREPRAA